MVTGCRDAANFCRAGPPRHAPTVGNQFTLPGRPGTACYARRCLSCTVGEILKPQSARPPFALLSL